MPFYTGGSSAAPARLDDFFFTDSDIVNQYLVGGPLWLWGTGTSGQLGDNTTVSKSSPVQTVTLGTYWKQVAVGGGFVAAVTDGGSLWLWGKNYYNAPIGDNTTTDRSSPVQTVTGGTTWKQVSCGFGHTAAVKTDGTLWTWGRNYDGQLGDSSPLFGSPRSSPVQTTSRGTSWSRVSCGSYFTAAVKTDGTLWLWGMDTSGQLGDNSATNKTSPVQTVTGGNNWKLVACGGSHTAAIKTDGTLWAWGLGTSGQLGDNTITSKSSPVQTIAGGTTWSAVSCGDLHTAAVKSDGTLWSWGLGTSGQLGDNTIIRKSSPIQTIAGGTTWSAVSCGYKATAAIKTDGTLWSWGLGTSGQFGNNSITSRSSPVQTIAGGTNWKQVSIGSQGYGVSGITAASIKNFG